MVFAMMSLGGRVDKTVHQGNGPNMFQLQGANYHLMGSMKPKENDYAKFSQLYIVDTDNEVTNRETVLRRLFQQYIVDAYSTIESNRLEYIKVNQSKLRCQNYSTVKEAADSRVEDMGEQGNPISILASFTGSPRYMVQSYYDAMAICKHYGFPDLFITFTSMYTVEFQKQGSPHAHILLFMDKRSKLPTADDINKIICAEIPDKDKKPELYEIIKDNMIHGPCGAAKRNSPCMVDGRCSKMYTKAHPDLTKVGKDCYPIYRRRNGMNFIEKGGFKCEYRYVVPYNEKLCLRYRAHINVERCNQTGSIKYMFKYINKGSDRVVVVVEPVNKSATSTTTNVGNTAQNKKKKKNEIKDYFDCRYVSASEAIWRIFKFPIQFRTTPVQRLSFHVEGKKPCYFKMNADIEEVLEKAVNEDSKLTAWFYLNTVNPEANQYLYAEIRAHFTWQGKKKQWNDRKRGFSLGRIDYVPRRMEPEYFMRILLNIVRGPKLFDDLKTYKGVVYKTYKEACFARGIRMEPKQCCSYLYKQYCGCITVVFRSSAT
ncbi:PREDICTED: uncharacterized protein LOC104753363 [Camelina sativa]|uniref:Uncharacterized protein LOC104753363 n=1 Tax=Camelina sativa TaxID=90675 RepID=A0ABM1R2J5_CAMSA|nr:PREDICTED: uncharacterized protein LOC104753363 [Camelina sativa]